ncbi:MAG: proton-conducting transporter membrane subunit [Bacteroidales bacterium]|nr:proton-conducting transporter membrane subunit [Bacteroidales bacterium]
MLILFFIFSICISICIFIAKSKIVNRILFPLFITSQIALSAFSYTHQDIVDSYFFKFDALGILLGAVLTILSLCTYYYSLIYLKRKGVKVKSESQYFAALILFITAMVSSNYTGNIALLWASIEATTLFASILIFHERTKDALEAAWKYLFVSSVGIAIAFIGILFMSIIASNSGLNNLSFDNLASASENMNPIWLKISFLLILTGFSVKISLFPLYAVAIDAKTIAPSPVNALMSTALVNVGFLVIYRSYVIISGTEVMAWAQHVLMLTGIISLIIASIQLTRVKRLKRLYAFSTMEHMGIVFLGLSVGGIGYYAAVLHLIFHSFVKAGLFYQINQIHTLFKSKWIYNFGGFFKLNPFAGLAMLLGLVSITAMPPSGLFVSEFMIFKAMFFGDKFIYAGVSLFFITAILYFFIKNFLQILYAPSQGTIEFQENEPYENVIQILLYSLVIYLGVTPPYIFTDLINAVVSGLN